MYVNIYNLYMQTAKHSNKHTHANGHNNTFLFTYKYIVVFIQKLKRRLHNKTVLLTNNIPFNSNKPTYGHNKTVL